MKRLITILAAVAAMASVALADTDVGPKGAVQLWAGGPYWATTNLGAEEPENYGYYFWWGDTLGYKRENEQWVATDGSSSGFSFKADNAQIQTVGKDVATLQSEGWITSDGVLTPTHDAAQVHWGGNWRMPTNQEQLDLRDNCDWIWTTRNGVGGYEVRGKGDYASNSIFLPAAGYGYGTSTVDVDYGFYWSSVVIPDNQNSWMLYFCYPDTHYVTYGGRRCGNPIRPVQSPAE